MYSTDYDTNVYLHSYLDLNIGQDPVKQNFKFDLFKNVTDPNPDLLDNQHILGSNGSTKTYTLAFI